MTTPRELSFPTDTEALVRPVRSALSAAMVFARFQTSDPDLEAARTAGFEHSLEFANYAKMSIDALELSALATMRCERYCDLAAKNPLTPECEETRVCLREIIDTILTCTTELTEKISEVSRQFYELSGLLSTHISALESKVAEAKRNAKRAYDKRDNGIAITGAATIVAAVFFPALAPVILAKGISYSVIKDQTGDEFIRLQTNYKDIRDKAVATQKTSSVIITQITGLHNFWNTVKTALDTVPTTLDSTSPNAYKKVAFLWKSAPSLKVSMGEIKRIREEIEDLDTKFFLELDVERRNSLD